MWRREAEDLKWKQEKVKEKQEEEEEKARAAAEAAEAARREKEEYEKWMGSFSIESGGTVDDAQQEESQVVFPFQRFLSNAFFLFVFPSCACHSRSRASSRNLFRTSTSRRWIALCFYGYLSSSLRVQVVQLDALADAFKLTPVEVKLLALCWI